MRRSIAYSLFALATIGAAFGLLLAIAAHSYEGQVVRAVGVILVALGAVVAFVGHLILRSRP